MSRRRVALASLLALVLRWFVDCAPVFLGPPRTVRSEEQPLHSKTVWSTLGTALATMEAMPANAKDPVTSSEWTAYFERIYFWQPLVGSLLLSGVLITAIVKGRRAAELREAWAIKEDGLRRLRAETLGGKVDFESMETAVSKLCDDMERLQEEEVSTRELIGFGEATPTSIRYGLNLPRPASKIAKRMGEAEARIAAGREAAETNAAEMMGAAKTAAPSRTPIVSDETAEILLVAIGIPLLVTFLLYISA